LVAVMSQFVRWYRPGERLSPRDVAEQSIALISRELLAPVPGYDETGNNDRP